MERLVKATHVTYHYFGNAGGLSMSWKRYYLKASVFRNELWSLKKGRYKTLKVTEL